MNPRESIASRLNELFTCSQVNNYTRVRTPFLYPDGDVIDLFLEESGESATLTDLGETLRWLRMQAVGGKRSPKQRQLIQDVCLNHGVELFRGMLSLRVSNAREMSSGVMRLSQAAVRVADLWFTFRTRAIESVTDEVAEYLAAKTVPFERGEKLAGRSGRIWTVDFHARTSTRSSLVMVLSTGSRAAARGIAEHTLATFYDLSHLKASQAGLSFISLVDDTQDVWADEDFKLVEDVSEPILWSHPDELLLKLAA